MNYRNSPAKRNLLERRCLQVFMCMNDLNRSLFEGFYVYYFRVLFKSVGVPRVIIVMLYVITNMNKMISALLQATHSEDVLFQATKPDILLFSSYVIVLRPE